MEYATVIDNKSYALFERKSPGIALLVIYIEV